MAPNRRCSPLIFAPYSPTMVSFLERVPFTCYLLFPADTARQLVQDFHLPEHDLRERNLNRFMAYIGKLCLHQLK